MPLVKKAEGLQRFMLDCGFWRSRKWTAPGLGLAAMGLHAAGISYCHEHGTDGILPAGPAQLARALGLERRDVTRALKPLIDNGIWRDHRADNSGSSRGQVPDTSGSTAGHRADNSRTSRHIGEDVYEIVGYLDHNPSRSDVDAYRRKKADAAVRANHLRWHEERQVRDPECPLCTVAPAIPRATTNGSNTESHVGSHNESQTDRTSDTFKHAEEAEEASSPTPPTSSDETSHASHGSRGGDPPSGPDQRARYNRLLDHAANLDRQRAIDRGEPIRDPDAYWRRCREKRASQHGNDLRHAIATHPDWPDERILDLLDGQPITTVPNVDETAAWIAERNADDQANATERERLDAAIAALPDHQRAELRQRAEAEIAVIGGRRSEPLIAARMRQLHAAQARCYRSPS